MNTDRFIYALINKGYTLDELNELTPVQVRDLYDEEYPTLVVVKSGTASGGTSTSITILPTPTKKAA